MSNENYMLRRNIYIDNKDGTTLLRVCSKQYGLVCFIVDTDMVSELSKHSWHVINDLSKDENRNKIRFYGVSTVNKKTIRLHRFVLGVHTIQGGVAAGVVDHIDRNTLNNTKGNLRFVSNRKNSQNTERFKGWRLHSGRYEVSVLYNKETIFVGGYSDAATAEAAYYAFLDDPQGFIARKQEKQARKQAKPPRRLGCITLEKDRWRLRFKDKHIGKYDSREEAEAVLQHMTRPELYR